jgi:hypothetical protein
MRNSTRRVPVTAMTAFRPTFERMGDRVFVITT